MKKHQQILDTAFEGINANNNIVSIAKIVIECPEGKLVCPDNVFPTITKLLWSNTAAGRGTENIFFNKYEDTSDSNRLDIKDSHILGI